MEKGQLSLADFRFLQFREGDRRAFEYYFKEYYNSIVGFAIQFIGDKDKAGSIAQDAFIKLWENREKVQKINGIRSFLYTSVKTDCLNLIRHNKVVRKYESKQLQARESSLHTEILNSLNFDSVTFSELESLIEKSIEELPDKCKLVFVKKRFENKKNKEIADELGITLKAVEANITRATKFLKLRLSHYVLLIIIYCFLQF
ncbi:RNA polymerase sigma-70 factor (ECF subfamily) [Arenibacter algicola]|uniref:RNA polymerase sigma-70 factor (ECF subfamily) n=1 Tax=Arenibacter algicola TaxID=616991 RepID=A0ABY3ACL5_9FLAO|nr:MULTISPECIES: RNA polymerase sigma-70 factor [Arenibacter]GBF21345.1 ECF RNA polymerase sigma factor SigW [Arenibacter sp. NBRC 103722]|tara:strand:- start:5765 stop:6370 length:606 start_codon:yes stop_codon:yes gene_type:complete